MTAHHTLYLSRHMNRHQFWLLLAMLFSLVPLRAVWAGNQPVLPGSPLQVDTDAYLDTDAYSLINEVNALRTANGLPAYSINSILMTIAQQHAEYMSVNGVSHIGYGGTRPYQRALNAGYPLAGDLSLGGFISENITAGNNKSVQQAVLEWQGDAPHLNTMLSPNLTEIGAGVAIVSGYVYYVIDCAQPTSSGAVSYTPQPTSSSGGTGTTPKPGGAVAPLVSTIIPNTPDAEGKLYHTVKPGETLWLIAITYGVKIADIRRLNGLAENQEIFPGTKLLILKMPTPTPMNTVTVTLPPTRTPFATWTPSPTITSITPTPQKTAAASPSSSMTVLGVIVLAALVLSGVMAVSLRVRR